MACEDTLLKPPFLRSCIVYHLLMITQDLCGFIFSHTNLRYL